jgi:quinol monooxygenase YgiN
MAVVAVVERRARTGRAEVLIAAARRRWAGAGPGPVGRRCVRLFQGADEPEQVLAVAEWATAEAYWAHRRRGDAEGLEALSIAPAPPRLYAWRWRYEHLARSPAVLSAVTLRIPPEARTTVPAQIDAARDQVRAAAGLVLHLYCQDLADPGQLLLLQGWTSAAALAAYRADVAPALLAAQRARGVQVDRFTGQPRADDAWTPPLTA